MKNPKNINLLGTYKKEYTRDYSYIMQEGWRDAISNPLKRFGVGTNPYQPPILLHMKDGTVELWEHERTTEWLIKNLQNKITENELLAFTILDEHEEELLDMRKYWNMKVITSKKEFKEYVRIVYTYMYNFALMYYMAVNEHTPESLRKRALKIRDADIFFGTNDDMIRLSLRTMYPELAGFETAILFHEIDNPPAKEILAARKQHSTLDGNSITVGTLSEFRLQHPQYQFIVEAQSSDCTIIKGQIGNNGYAKGKVRLLKRKEQISSVQPGDIIVSAMTTPEFVPAMRIAAAFVTDEGGITCHAAIIARELNKPCVIGTKISSEALKDGDEVEVDADNGLVKILKL